MTNQRRAELIELLTRTNCTIRDACLQLNLKYESAKAIYRVYRLEDRVKNKKDYASPAALTIESKVGLKERRQKNKDKVKVQQKVDMELSAEQVQKTSTSSHIEPCVEDRAESVANSTTNEVVA